MSPRKKKIKLSPRAETTERNKRTSEPPESPRKRMKHNSKEEEIKIKIKKNFITACEQVSRSDYFDHRTRLLLLHLPTCMTICNHDKNGWNIKQIPIYAEDSFQTEIENNMWYDALEVCYMCLTPTQYLSSDMLKEIVEIIMNVHEDEYSEHTVKQIIDKSQQILMQSFSMHPPCFVKSIRNIYNKFLTSSLRPKEGTFTNRSQYEFKKGVVKYCMNRLEYEISADSQDGPLINREENIPEEMRHGVKGLHWQKEKFEIFEMLNRQERINRLFAVLEIVIELLQFDLAIWHSRYTKDLGRHLMRSHKPLMAYVLWSDNVLYTGAVTNNCRQIMRIFAHMVHLEYPDAKVKILATWLNLMIQTFYICETHSNTDYPNAAKYCNVFAFDFYKIIADMPHASIIRILERIEPAFMRHLIGVLHLNKILPTTDPSITQILINFIIEKQWKLHPPDNYEINLSKKLFQPPKRVKDKNKYLLKICKKLVIPEDINKYAKLEPRMERSIIKARLDNIVHCLYITFEAYLNAYDLKRVQETWNDLNEQLMKNTLVEDEITDEPTHYLVTETLVKTYRNLAQSVKELQTLFADLNMKGNLPEVLTIFGKIELLGLL